VAGASTREPDYVVADGETGDPGAEFGHHSRQVAALSRRKRRRKDVLHGTRANRRLTDVDAGRPDLDEDLTVCWHGVRHVTHLKDLQAPV
jgi:hypothetical protein